MRGWISFTAPMAAAILRDEKTETRRLRAPSWTAGDRVRVLEPIRRDVGGGTFYTADGTAAGIPWRWKPSGLPGRFMPHALSRIEVEILDVREEQLQDITDAAIAGEGVTLATLADLGVSIARISTVRERPPREVFAFGWDAINGRTPGGRWAENPRVHVSSFRRLRP